MKKAGKKLLLSSFVLLVAMSLAVTSTFAWFTMSANPTVQGWEANVTATDGLQIAATPETAAFVSYLDFATLKSANGGDTGVFSRKFDAITPKTGSLDEFEKYEIDGTTMSVTEVTGTPYIQFKLWFKSTSQMAVYYHETDTSVYSLVDGGEDFNGAAANQNYGLNAYGFHPAYASGTAIARGAQNTTNQVGVYGANAARVSMIEYDADGVAKKTSGDQTIWYPNPYKGLWKGSGFDTDGGQTDTAFATNFAYVFANKENAYFTLDGTGVPATAKTSYENACKAFSTNYYQLLNSGSIVKVTDPTDTDQLAAALANNFVVTDRLCLLEEVTTGHPLFVSGQTTYAGCVQFTMWIEGWDGDVINTIMNDPLMFNFRFTGMLTTDSEKDPLNA